jgi:hypothetical protein
LSQEDGLSYTILQLRAKSKICMYVLIYICLSFLGPSDDQVYLFVDLEKKGMLFSSISLSGALVLAAAAAATAA